MSTAKQPNTRITRLASYKSSANPTVTLFEASEVTSSTSGSALSPNGRRHVKVEGQAIADLEDVVSPPSRKRPTRGTKKQSMKPDSEDSDAPHVSASPRKRRKAASASGSITPTAAKKQKPIKLELDVPHTEPPRWREAYEAIKVMRQGVVAPVDTMGCEKAPLNEIDPKARRVSVLISLMLSSQTKDEVTSAAMDRLREALGGSVTVEALLDADESTISNAISKVGFWRRKTEYIKKAVVRLRDDFDSDVPKTVDELCSLPGVGPKMAFLTLQVAWDLNIGIGVDIHVHRITNRLGWHKPLTKNPEETRLNLQSWLPKEFHKGINPLLVGFGQTICVPVGPRCSECSLSSGLCPSANLSVNLKGRKALIRVKEEVKEESTDESHLVSMETEKDELLVKEEPSEEIGAPPSIFPDVLSKREIKVELDTGELSDLTPPPEEPSDRFKKT